MNYLILALLVAFSLSATAGKPTKEQFDASTPVESKTIKPCGNADPQKGSNVDAQKGVNPKGGKPCDDGADSKRAPTSAAPSDKTNPPKK